MNTLQSNWTGGQSDGEQEPPALSGAPSEEFLAKSSAPTRGGGQKMGEGKTLVGGIDALNPPDTIEPARRGRPRVLTAGLKAVLCQLLSDGLSRRQAAIALDIVHSTIANEMARDAEFAAKVAKAEELSVIKPLQAIARASEKNWRAATWLLARNERRLREAETKSEEEPGVSPVNGETPTARPEAQTTATEPAPEIGRNL